MHTQKLHRNGDCEGYSAERDPRVPELKLSKNRTVCLSKGTVVPPDCMVVIATIHYTQDQIITCVKSIQLYDLNDNNVRSTQRKGLHMQLCCIHQPLPFHPLLRAFGKQPIYD